jgi:Inner membrane protein YgaP-like, transmembrane domain
MKRPTVNITPGERVGRVLIGAAGAIGGLVLLAATSAVGVGILEALLVIAGLDLVVTGALGHCPLYAKLGHVPPSLRRAS